MTESDTRLRADIERLGPCEPEQSKSRQGCGRTRRCPTTRSDRWLAIEPFLGDVAGKTVLDIGCNAGSFSMRMKERGASRVVSIDI